MAQPDCNLRARWIPDPEPYDAGDTIYCDRHVGGAEGFRDCEECSEIGKGVWAFVEAHGVYGCIVERQCGTCGAWSEVDSLWNICGDDAYRAEIERELLAEARQ